MNGQSTRSDQTVLARARRSSGDWVSLFGAWLQHPARQTVGKWLIRLGFGWRLNAMEVVARTPGSLTRCLRVLSRISLPAGDSQKIDFVSEVGPNSLTLAMTSPAQAAADGIDILGATFRCADIRQASTGQGLSASVPILTLVSSQARQPVGKRLADWTWILEREGSVFSERALEVSRPRSTTCLSEHSRLRLSALASTLGKRRCRSSTPSNFLTSPRHLSAGSALFAHRRWWTWDRLALSRRATCLAEVAEVRSANASDEY